MRNKTFKCYYHWVENFFKNLPKLPQEVGVVGEVGRGKHNCIEKVVIKFL